MDWGLSPALAEPSLRPAEPASSETGRPPDGDAPNVTRRVRIGVQTPSAGGYLRATTQTARERRPVQVDRPRASRQPHGMRCSGSGSEHRDPADVRPGSLSSPALH